MAAIILALAASFLIGGLTWLLTGFRFGFNEDDVQNDILNFFAFVGIVFPFLFAIVFFIIGG